MRVALKITLWLVVLVLAVVFVEVALHVEGERRLVEEDLRERHRSVGELLRTHTEHLGRHEGWEAAREGLRAYNTAHTGARWRLLRAPEAARGPCSASDALLLRGEVVFWQPVVLGAGEGEGGESAWVSCWPLRGSKGEVVWVLEGTESLRPHEARFEQELERAVWVGACVVVLALLCSLVLGYGLVGRHAQRLLNRFEQVKRGDWASVRPRLRRDELSAVEVAFEAMVDHLREAREALAQEQERRQRAVQQLRQADRLRSVGTLAAGVAHELGTPLHVIEGRAIMLRDRAQGRDARAARSAGIIVEQSERVQRIVRRLMDLSRQDVLASEAVDLGALCRHTVELLASHARGRGVELVCACAEGAGQVVRGERVSLEHALMNVVDNAIAASAQGGTVEVGVVAAPERGEAAVVVQDDGAGMDAQVLAQAQDPFFTTKEVGEGTGLGLSITRGIVDEHRGRLELVSACGVRDHGTRVCLWFPTARVRDEQGGGAA